MRKLRLFLILILTVAALSAKAQPAIPAGRVDIFMGVDFNYRDIMHKKIYELLVNLTPGVKWNMGKGWQLAGQFFIPVYNDWGGFYGRPKLNVAAVSKEFYFKNRWFLKASAGLFSQNRYGLDVKGMFVVKDWLAFEAQAGFTGYCYFTTAFAASAMDRLTGHAGVDFYIPRYDTQFRLRGGRYVYEDYGATLDIMRHFKHVTVGVFGQYSNKGGRSIGFQVVALLPPYRRSARKVNFRPASNFRFSYTYDAQSYANVRYDTDPEENDREGWFDTQMMQWGVNATHQDFIYKERREKTDKKQGKEVKE